MSKLIITTLLSALLVNASGLNIQDLACDWSNGFCNYQVNSNFEITRLSGNDVPYDGFYLKPTGYGKATFTTGTQQVTAPNGFCLQTFWNLGSKTGMQLEFVVAVRDQPNSPFGAQTDQVHIFAGNKKWYNEPMEFMAFSEPRFFSLEIQVQDNSDLTGYLGKIEITEGKCPKVAPSIFPPTSDPALATTTDSSGKMTTSAIDARTTRRVFSNIPNENTFTTDSTHSPSDSPSDSPAETASTSWTTDPDDLTTIDAGGNGNFTVVTDSPNPDSGMSGLVKFFIAAGVITGLILLALGVLLCFCLCCSRRNQYYDV